MQGIGLFRFKGGPALGKLPLALLQQDQARFCFGPLLLELERALLQLQLTGIDLGFGGGKLVFRVGLGLFQLPEAQLNGLNGTGKLDLGGSQLVPLAQNVFILLLKLRLGDEKRVSLGGVVRKLGVQLVEIGLELGQGLLVRAHGLGGGVSGIGGIPGGLQNGEHHLDQSQAGFELAHAALELDQARFDLGHARIHLLAGPSWA